MRSGFSKDRGLSVLRQVDWWQVTESENVSAYALLTSPARSPRGLHLSGLELSMIFSYHLIYSPAGLRVQAADNRQSLQLISWKQLAQPTTT